jgi:hypothetical protein
MPDTKATASSQQFEHYYNVWDALAIVYTLCLPEISDIETAERQLRENWLRHQKHRLSHRSSYGCGKPESRCQTRGKVTLRVRLHPSRGYPIPQPARLLRSMSRSYNQGS